MSPQDYEALTASVKAHEGLSLSMYTDSTGHWTIGYGRNIQDDGISQAEANMLLKNDLNNAIAACQHLWPWFDGLDGPRQRVLVEMLFNMGQSRLLEFRNMLAAVQAGDYARAAAEMLRSVWATQVGIRARQLSDLMQNGTVSA